MERKKRWCVLKAIKNVSILRENLLVHGWGMSTSAQIYAWKKCSKAVYFVIYRVFSCKMCNLYFYSQMHSYLKDLPERVYMWHTVCGGFWDIVAQTWTIYYTLYRENKRWFQTCMTFMIYKGIFRNRI